MARDKRVLTRITLTALTTAIAIAGMAWGMHKIKLPEVEAAMIKTETVALRIIGTTDLHGQLNSTDYEKGVDYSKGGLARVFDLISTARSEVPANNAITLDAGDVLFDYTTEYIFSENQREIQPIYQAMSHIGYDAITLGNHDFDYGYEYILRQLNGSGLREITVVSNVMDSKTDEYPFRENMILKRMMTTASGKKVEVTIGIIGQTIPVLTGKTHSYKGILKTQDMVENAKEQAVKLKEMGADIVIALSHTGIGPENPELNFKNVAYALTKIPEVDVVVSGHEHNYFPTKDMTSPYYKLPNVDKTTFLMNGKNVIMAGDRGRAIGIVDLTLDVSGDNPVITSRSSSIREVTADTTTEDVKLAKLYGDWEEKLAQYSTDIIASLPEGKVIQNFYGLLGDNSAIQLLNDSKIDYAIRYVNNTGKSYMGYPIIAASTYASYGRANIDDYIKIKDSITESDLTSIQPYNDYLYIYEVTGKQLKEWLEWSASAYETRSVRTSWKSPAMSELMNQTSARSLIREEWLDNWSNFYIFDGIDYVIDPTNGPRYDISGNMISSNNRVVSMTYNGKQITDDMTMLLVTNKITQPSDANSGIEKQAVLNGFNRSQSVLGKYLNRLAQGATIIPEPDYNWRVSLPEGNRFVIKTPSYADALVQKTPWFVERVLTEEDYSYSVATYPVENGDRQGPHIIATPKVVSTTGSPYDVGVQATDRSELVRLKYMNGTFGVEASSWSMAPDVTDHRFLVKQNGVYTIYAEDSYGNKSVYHLNISNFSDKLLGSPTVNTYTNRKTKISGRAEPDTTIIFEAYTGVYKAKVTSFGTFSYELPAQPSETEVEVYIRNDAKGLESARVIVPVKRTGPNQPSINPLSNNDGYLTGVTNDKDATIIAIADNIAYVPELTGKELYLKNTEIYDRTLKIVEVTVDISETGHFVMMLPPQAAGTEVILYNLDHLSRNSRETRIIVDEVAPNAPYVYDVTNIDNALYGYIPDSKELIYDVFLTINDRTYYSRTDNKGSFTFQMEEQLYAGQSLTVVAYDIKNGAIRASYPMQVIVKDIESYVRTHSINLTLDMVTDKSNLIEGYYYDLGTIYLAIAKGTGEEFSSTLLKLTTDDNGKISYQLEERLKVGTIVYAMARMPGGRILLANKAVVALGVPDIPLLVKEITNSDKTVEVIAEKDSEVTLTIGAKTYKTTVNRFDEINGYYIYSINTDRDISGTVVTATATNATGASEVLSTTIQKAAPDQPIVNQVKMGDKLITGRVELLVAPDGNITEPTRVFAQIGKKTYEGKVDELGNYEIKVPEQKEGALIRVWGMNYAGRGPLIKVLVSK